MDNLERRSFAECRAEASDNGKKIRGYAIVFNSMSVDLGGFREIIAPDAGRSDAERRPRRPGAGRSRQREGHRAHARGGR
jgi:phage head maturation protease